MTLKTIVKTLSRASKANLNRSITSILNVILASEQLFRHPSKSQGPLLPPAITIEGCHLSRTLSIRIVKSGLYFDRYDDLQLTDSMPHLTMLYKVELGKTLSRYKCIYSL